jgi:hypothetical protein
MRFPVGKLGTKEEFSREWYDAQPFGTKTSYGFHEGPDMNLKSGGDSDLGEPLYAVNKGRIVYYHNESHPNANFGRHMVLECNTPLGRRWFHYAHCQEITARQKDVEKGEIIGKLGKSGTSSAHLHFAVFKVDPGTLPQGIDTIAKSQQQLNDWWEDAFITLNSTDSEPGVPHWLTTLLAERGLTIENEADIRNIFEKAKKYDDEVPTLKTQLSKANQDLADKSLEVATLVDKNAKLTADKETLEEDLAKARMERDTALWEKSKAENLVKSLEEENKGLVERVKRLEENNSLYAYTWSQRFVSLFRRG